MGAARADLTLMIQDEALGDLGIDLMEKKQLELRDDTVDRFLDGPATRRIGVVDFDPSSGRPLPAPAAFIPFATTNNAARGSFPIEDLPRDDRAFIAVNAFGTVFETVRMFEERAGMGRQVDWAFPGEQLLVVPRAGEMANAYYDRATRSLQFFWFSDGDRTIYTALSRDIVAHECGHALLDAVAPDLYDSLTPESIAIHEAIADLVAVLMALRSAHLTKAVLAATKNKIDNATHFSSIAEDFGAATSDTDRPRAALRDLRTKDTMSTVDRSDPHTLSTVLSALLYESLLSAYDALYVLNGTEPRQPQLSGDRRAGWALGSASIIFRRQLLRGIDYLPPGELTFADVGRAILAADRAGDPDRRPERAQARADLAQRFVDRGIVSRVQQLASSVPRGLDLDPAALVDVRDSDWAAYAFVERCRSKLHIPPAVSFHVYPRIDASKEIGSKDPVTGRYRLQRELILKVSWDAIEKNGVAAVPAESRRLRTGATMVWNWADGRLIAALRSDVAGPQHRRSRDAMLTKLVVDHDQVTVHDDDEQQHPPGSPGSAGIAVRLRAGAARVTGTQTLLHLDPLP